MKLLKNMMNNQYLYVFLIVISSGLLIFLVDRFMRRENFESYTEEIKQMVRENDVRKDKYEAQDVSQESVEEQKEDVLDIVEDTQKMMEGKDASENDIKPEDLIPSDEAADVWSNVNPKGEGSLELKNFLEAGFHIGVDTQSNTLRNANRSIRSDVPIPMKDVSVFLNSTISADPYRKTFEIS